MLDGVRVLDLTTEIAGPYCTKILADARADVVKVEPEGGDPLRRWRSGALFGYLNASKRSVAGEVAHLATGSDIVVADGAVEVAALGGGHRAQVLVSISPFGLEGPWAGRPATEFTLQAACGSMGYRGLPEDPPMAAGGRLGEFVTGTYAAIGALAAWREARRSGHGEHVDVAMLDCMASTMITYPSVLASFGGWPPQEGTGRSLEVPSIYPTTDGFVVFTTNSAQQFADFVVMIERPDLLEDPELAGAAARWRRRAEFEAYVEAYTTKRSTEEVLERASLFRIPAGPVLDGSTIERCEQFVARQLFVPSPSGPFRQPRAPYRITGAEPRPFTAAPAPGQHTAEVAWEPRDPATADEWRYPLEGLRVLDCTAWWAGPIASSMLAALGADVVKVEAAGRPDPIRFLGFKRPGDDLWWECGPVFHAANVSKRGITLDLSRPEGVAAFERLTTGADVVIENYTPRVMPQFGLTWERLHEVNPDLVMVRMPAFGLDGPWRDRTGFAQTIECLAGMASVTGSPDVPPVLVRGACDPLGGMHAVIAALLALLRRDEDGGGRLVEAAMVEASLNVAAEQVLEYSGSGTLLGRTGNRSLVAAPQGAYPCLGEDRWLALAVATDEQWEALVDELGRPPWATDPSLGHAEGRRARHDELDAHLGAWAAGVDAEEAAERLTGRGVPAERVIPSREVLFNPQLVARGLFETEHHPVMGDQPLPVVPFRFSRVPHWLRGAAPTLGQHNDEVLTQAGFAAEEIDALRQAGIIGETLAGG